MPQSISMPPAPRFSAKPPPNLVVEPMVLPVRKGMNADADPVIMYNEEACTCNISPLDLLAGDLEEEDSDDEDDAISDESNSSCT